MSVADFVHVAIDTLNEANKLESEGKLRESLRLYEIGLEILLQARKSSESNRVLLPDITSRARESMSRAERIKERIDSENKLDIVKLSPGQHQQIKITKDSIGHSYRSIFLRFLAKGDVTEIQVDEPYIQDSYQVSNFVSFCEMVFVSPSKVKRINLKTKPANQQDLLNTVVGNLQKKGIDLSVTYLNYLHDREIRFNNGWIVKIGRGLDYFKRLPNEFALGLHDFDLRPCLETTVDIFHNNAVTVSGDK